MGPLSRDEKVVMGSFVGMVALWASAATFGIDSTAVAFLGLGVLLVSGALTLDDIAKQGDVLATFIWFAVLYTLSSELNALGFMGFLGARLADAMVGWQPVTAGIALLGAYVLLHYVFVEPDGPPHGALRRVHGRRRQAGRARRSARVPASLRDELLLGDHAAGVERELVVYRQRVSVSA